MERINFRRRIAPAVAMSLAALSFAACVSDSGSAEEDSEPQPEEIIEGAGVTYTYYDDGSRMTEYADPYSYSYEIAYCDGQDLKEQSGLQSYDRGASGNAIERSVSHPACADGKLTPEDFKIPG